FVPGEGAGALLLGRPQDARDLVCTGVGFAEERARVDSTEPLRADGLVLAIRRALTEAGCEMHQLDFRITDVSAEQYYFKETALAATRMFRVRKEQFEMWHPADCIGESGALAGVLSIAVAYAASRKGYADGANILIHAANDAGQRAAAVLKVRMM